jgi:hypothetical protein
MTNVSVSNALRTTRYALTDPNLAPQHHPTDTDSPIEPFTLAGARKTRAADGHPCSTRRSTSSATPPERCFNKLKQHRAVATRYDKRDYVDNGTIEVASTRIWLRDLTKDLRDTT